MKIIANHSSIMKSAILFAVLFSSQFGLSENPTLAENAIKVSLNQEGFKVISAGVRELILSDIDREPMPDLDENVGLGIQAHLTQMDYSVRFKNFNLSSGDGVIYANVEFDDIVVNIPRARFTKKVGTTISSTCKNIILTAGAHSSVQLAMALIPTVENGEVRLTPQNIDFPLPEEEFQVNGPSSCSGSLGIGKVIRYTINRAIAKARNKIAESLEKKIHSSIPSMATKINTMITGEIPVSLGQTGGLPLKSLVLAAKPYQVHVTSNAALFALSVDVREGLKGLKDDNLKELKLDQSMIELGQFGLRTAFINELVATTLPPLPAAIEIDTRSTSVMREIFSRQGLSSILPDINTVEMDSDIVFARIGFETPPQISTNIGADGGATLALNINQMKLFIDILKNGVRTPYFEFNFNAQTHIHMNILKQQMLLSLTQPSSIQVDGSWAPNYQPQVPLFERDVAQTIFYSALDILCHGGVLARIDVPEFEWKPNEALTIVAPHIAEDFIMVKLASKINH